MKGVILEIDPEARIVDIDHSVAAHDIRRGAYALYSAASWFPFAVHVGVVDPGVGTQRRASVIACEGAIFIGPDNGLLIPAAETFGIKEVREITNKEYTLRRASYVFHGRDIFAPVAAHLSKGVKLRDLGPPITDHVKIDFGTPEVDEEGIRGEVLTVDRFGNIITNIPRALVSDRWRFNQELEVSIGGGGMPLPALFAAGATAPGGPPAAGFSPHLPGNTKREGGGAARGFTPPPA